MQIGILACEALEPYVSAAQETMGTAYPVFFLDRRLHDNPDDMKRHIQAAIAALPPALDTILIAMGFCGGSWDHVMAERRIVIPRVDDCVSLLLQLDDAMYQPNTKELGHLYLTGANSAQLSPTRILQTLRENTSPQEAEATFQMWFSGYSHLDIIDTGHYDCYAEDFVANAQMEADLIGCTLDFVPGSNRMLEKLVSGNWDMQFLVAEPGHCIRHGDFFG